MHSRHLPRLGIPLVLLGAFATVTSADCLVDQSQDSWNSTSGGFRWQSFTAGETGLLCRIDLNTDGAQQNVTMELYEGEGLLGAQLHQQIVDLAGDVTSVAIDAPVVVALGSTYTIHFPDIANWRLQTGDPYPGGIGSINPDVDFWFRTYVDIGGPVPTEARSWSGVKANFR